MTIETTQKTMSTQHQNGADGATTTMTKTTIVGDQKIDSTKSDTRIITIVRHGERVDNVDPQWKDSAPRAWDDPHLSLFERRKFANKL